MHLWELGRAGPLPRHYAKIVRFLGSDPEPGGSSFSGRLRTVRRRLGLSQAELASLAGLDEGSICRWESGRRAPSRWMSTRVAAVLEALELGGQPPGLSYFERTRWRRTPPTDVTAGEPNTIGDQLRQRRLELGLSQHELARQFGVDRSTLHRWECGASKPRPESVAIIERLLRA